MRGDIRHRHVILEQQGEDAAARRVGQRREYAVETLFHGVRD
jgi:hypothetical protein